MTKPNPRSLYRIARRHVGTLSHELKVELNRRRCERAQRKLGDAYLATTELPKLHIGCGKHRIDGWLNSDYVPADALLMHLDATERFPFEDGTFANVFSEHMIEHVQLAGGIAMLKECFRVLRPGGRLRIATPDLQFLVDLLRRDKSILQEEYLQWSNREFIQAEAINDVIVLNNYVRDWGHLFIYDQQTLMNIMQDAGFSNITRYAVGVSDCAELHGLENIARMPDGFLELESLVLEAVKPAR
jgi:predicted SAM-dependent methyltransferase